MNILIPINNAYFGTAMIMLKSLFANNSEKIVLYVFYSELERNKLAGLRKWVNQNDEEIKIIKIDDDSMMQGVPVASFSKETYFRLFAPLLLPENVHRVLYLDTDMIINGDISDCYHLDFHENLFMAVPDTSLGIDEVKKKLNIGRDIYINAGVLLMNLDLLRKELDLKELLLFAKKHPDQVQNCDQDLINKFFHDKIGLIDWKYNYEARFHGLLDFINYPFFYLKYRKKIKVIHYMGADKPWKENYHGKFSIIFYKYTRKTILQHVAFKNILIWPLSVLKFFLSEWMNQIFTKIS